MDDQSIDENKDYFSELVGEGRKFKDEKALALAKARSDNYVKILEGRLDAMREDNLKLREENVAGAKLQDLLDKLELEKQQLSSRQEPKTNEAVNQPQIDETKIESLVSAKIEQAQQSRRQAENYSEVESKLLEVYGQNYKTTLKEQAKQLGLSDEEVNLMARNNPKLFYKTFDVAPRQREQFQTPPRSMQRTDNFAPKGPEKKTISYYKDMLKKNPMAWYDPKIAVEMDKMSQELGQSFYDD